MENNKKCPCEKMHLVQGPKVILENGAIFSLNELISQYAAKKVFLLADKNTYQVAGKQVATIIQELQIPFVQYIFEEDSLAPNEMAVGSAIMHYESDCDLVISVGSGVLNDIGKIVAAVSGKSYFIVATAPSMDGYASATSSMERGGLKVSIPSKCADVIIGDINILKNAPMQMLQAGLGDMVAKYTAIAEWRIANLLLGEYYCEEIANQVRAALKKCVDNADGLLQRNEEAVKAVFEGMVLCGLAMARAGCSRPASGVEHYISHIWDMRGLEFGTNVGLHGIQCAIGTNISAAIYEKVLQMKPDKQKALAYVRSFDYAAWSKQLKAFLGKGAETMIALEEKEQKYSVDKHEKRIEIILDKWGEICEIIREEIPAQKEIEEILDKIGAPKTVKEIGIDCDLLMALKATKDIRNKYILSHLLWDIGEIENIL